MRRSIILSAAALLAGLPITVAQAGAIAPQGIGAALDQQGLVNQVQYRWSGRDYCWYPDGWKGPGFYRCGYRLRVGQGWGGAAGWHGWRAGVNVGGGGGMRHAAPSDRSVRARVGAEPPGRIEGGTTGQGGGLTGPGGVSGGGGQNLPPPR
jgi:hypothetical protein